jgi:LacI family transcriptional regulator
MAVRLKDIAQDLGLSVVTISKALRNHPDIAEKTRKRVLRRVRELDYQPNLMARSLVTGRSYLVGLVVPGLMHPFFAEIARSLSSSIGAHGYSLILSSSEENPEMEAREMHQLTARRLDALVIATSGTERAAFDRLESHGVPYVLIDREVPGLSANFVGVDDTAVGRLATEHLIATGRRRIAHIRGRENSTGMRRLEGYRQALAEAGLAYSESLVVARSSVDIDSVRLGAEAMRLLLQRKPRPDAVFAYNDPLAIGAIDAILEAGLRIPRDIAVIGCGNLHYNNSLRVPLSSVDQRSSMIGERTAKILLRSIEAKTRPRPVSVILDPSLVIRESSLIPKEKGQKDKAESRKSPPGKGKQAGRF